ncbi:MAG: lysophospholipid acyltransferase family protein [Pseudomonadales bacterium]|nr:lysophospholipid acyltransferase family protein [Pseudomonadales bacterium]MCP5185589.1 lysophospholipid acyltransferase family protein [Pseudomonadales bacterium]
MFRPAWLAPRHWPLWLAWGLLIAVAWLPRGARRTIADAVAWLWLRLPDRRRQIARINLELCFPEWPEARRHAAMTESLRVATHVFLHYGAMAGHRLRTLGADAQFDGLDRLHALQAAGRNIILLTPHWTCFELVAQVLSPHQALASIVRLHDSDNPLDWLITRARTRYGARIFDHRGSMLAPLRAVKDGAWLLYLPDEDAGDGPHAFAPFFGRDKATTTALAKMVRATQAVVVPTSLRFDPDTGRFSACFHPPLEGSLDAGSMNAVLEELIRGDIHQYAWFTKLFRTTQPPARNPYKNG